MSASRRIGRLWWTGCATLMLTAQTAPAQTAAETPAVAAPSADRTEFCWAAVTNAALRYYSRMRRMPGAVDGTETLAGALSYYGGKIRGRYPDDDRLVEAMRAAAAEFGRSDIQQAASECVNIYRGEMSRFTELTARSMQ